MMDGQVAGYTQRVGAGKGRVSGPLLPPRPARRVPVTLRRAGAPGRLHGEVDLAGDFLAAGGQRHAPLDVELLPRLDDATGLAVEEDRPLGGLDLQVALGHLQRRLRRWGLAVSFDLERLDGDLVERLVPLLLGAGVLVLLAEAERLAAVSMVSVRSQDSPGRARTSGRFAVRPARTAP